MFEQTKLIDLIKNVPSHRTFIATKETTYSYQDVIETLDFFEENYSQLINQNCAIISDDRESLALFLPAIDNLCHNVFLLPKDVEKYQETFFQSAEINYLIYLSAGVCRVEEISQNQSTKLDKKYILATSGTTDIPKLASYSLSNLLITTKNDVNKGAEFIWGLSYDLNRFAGLQVYLQAISSGSTLIIPSAEANTNEMVSLFTANSVNAISATPSFWRKVLMTPMHQTLCLRRITLGGEISTQNVLSALEKAYPNAAIIHIYASTEVGVGFVVKDKKEGFPISYLENNSNTGCQLKLSNNTLWIKSEYSCTHLIQGKMQIDNEGFINTGDMISLENERVFFLGRDNGSINVGGNKVMPEKIESVLEEHPHILMAKVFSKANSVLGALVASEIVINQNLEHLSHNKLKSDILFYCKQKLQPFEIPALIKFVKSINTNSTGKKIRN